jgi:hypothetical protein
MANKGQKYKRTNTTMANKGQKDEQWSTKYYTEK